MEAQVKERRQSGGWSAAVSEEARDPDVVEKGLKLQALAGEIARVVVGQKPMIERLLVGVLCHGHVLLEGVPGLGKTLAVKTLARALDASFRRIQFTPDLLPADLIGTTIFNQKDGEFVTRRGPIFAHVVLADEVNRAPAKTQSALLEAMQECQVTIGDQTHKLREPFLVLATQNPIEQEGTYPLPEAQLDRFLLKVRIGYPTRDEELAIMRQHVEAEAPEVGPVLSLQDLLAARRTLRKVRLDEKIERHILDLVLATRQPQQFRLEKLVPLIRYGASPRASIGLSLAARAYALLRARAYVIPDDVHAVCRDVLRHRIGLTYEAEAEDVTVEQVLSDILARVPVP